MTLKARKRKTELADLDLILGKRQGKERCNALGLARGDCQERKKQNSLYCYYHDKVFLGLLDPRRPDSYPYLPLPDYPWQQEATKISAA